MVGPILSFGGFGATDDLGVDVKGTGNGNDLICRRRFAIGFETVTEVVDAVHLLIGGAGSPLNFAKERGYGEEIVLHVLHAGAETQAFGLTTAGAMDETSDGGTHLTQQDLGHRQVGAGGTEESLAYGKVGLG